MEYILNFDSSILNIFQVLEINGFVNYLLLNKYGNVFQYEMKGLKFYLSKINWKMNIWNLFQMVKLENYISCKDIIFGKFERSVQLEYFPKKIESWVKLSLTSTSKTI